LHKISDKEADFKLLKVKKIAFGFNAVPYVVTHDGRTIRYANPDISVNDTIKFNLKENKIEDFYKFDLNLKALVVRGHNVGRVGLIIKRESHPGTKEIIHLKDDQGVHFATTIDNVFIISSGKNSEALISIPSRKGCRQNIIQEQEGRNAAR